MKHFRRLLKRVNRAANIQAVLLWLLAIVVGCLPHIETLKELYGGI